MSAPEDALLFQIRALGLIEPVREASFALPRRWRWDFSWPQIKLACEVDGGVWVSGRHSTGKGYEEDCVKMASALLLGWRVLRVTPRMVEDGRAVRWIEQLLQKGGGVEC